MLNVSIAAVVAVDTLANARSNASVAALELVLVFARWNALATAAHGSVQVYAHLIASGDAELDFDFHCWWAWSF